MVFGDEHIDVLGREPVAPCIRGRQRRIDVEEAGNRLLLEPLASVSGRDARVVREFGSRRRDA